MAALQSEAPADEFDAVGKNVAAKLRHMSFHQKVLAESLIQQVITKGLFSELTRQTVLEERGNSAFVSNSPYANLPSTPTDESNSSGALTQYNENEGNLYQHF